MKADEPRFFRLLDEKPPVCVDDHPFGEHKPHLELTPAMIAECDRVAERLGFVSREPTLTSERFNAWCEEERITYSEGLDRLRDLLDRGKRAVTSREEQAQRRQGSCQPVDARSAA
jgi:hypothetical protein